MKKISLAAIALAASSTFASAGSLTVVEAFGMPGITGSLDVVETLSGQNGIYDVTNNTGGNLLGFGVSNIGTNPVLFNDLGQSSGFGCDITAGNTQICYETRRLTASNWNTEIAYSDPFSNNSKTFEAIFGTFSNVAGADSVFNWFDAVDGDLLDGDTSNDFFGFIGLNVASNIIGVSGNSGGTAFFTAGAATTPGTGNPSAVPLPAAAWMLMAGLGGLGAMKRRRKTT